MNYRFLAKSTFEEILPLGDKIVFEEGKEYKGEKTKNGGFRISHSKYCKYMLREIALKKFWITSD